MLDKLRNEIDAIDHQMLVLFEKRMDVAKQVGAYKKERNLPVLVPEREKAVIENRLSHLKNPEYRDLTVSFFTDVMSLSRQLQQRDMPLSHAASVSVENPRMAYLGRPGSYSEEALLSLFPDTTNAVSAETFGDVFKLLIDDKADYGVLPIENSSTGAINDVLDLLYTHHLFIVGESAIKVQHCLAAPKGATLAGVKKIYSHPQGFGQCTGFLSGLKAEKVTMDSTAASAYFVAKNADSDCAAIVSKRAAEIYGLTVLQENIQENKTNTTRFVVVSKTMEMTAEADKISIAFSLRHESGSLYRVIAKIAEYGMNLLHIESRPLPGKPFEYLFYADFCGNLQGEKEQAVLEELKSVTTALRILGNYPSVKESL